MIKFACLLYLTSNLSWTFKFIGTFCLVCSVS